jgi:hypothetical protein
MALFQNFTIQRFANEGETKFATDYPCIIKRYSPSVSLNQNLFTLPDDVKSIRRVTWLGFKCDPLPYRNYREVFQNATQKGRPFWYVYNNVGLNNIQIFPGANSSLSAGVNLFSATGLNNCLCIEYFQQPDFETAVIPTYIRRRLLKAYVLKSCFAVEGQGQNLKNSQYFTNRWNLLEQRYGELLHDLHNKPRKLVLNGIAASYYFPGQPVLPIDKFGISCDSGE